MHRTEREKGVKYIIVSSCVLLLKEILLNNLVFN
jgi:hypothetical protein